MDVVEGEEYLGEYGRGGGSLGREMWLGNAVKEGVMDLGVKSIYTRTKVKE